MPCLCFYKDGFCLCISFIYSPYELQRAWDKPVLDRVGLIIEIFNAHAHTKEGKLQVF